VNHRLRPFAPVLPVVAVIALLGLPLTPGEGGAGPADAVSGLVVLYCGIRLIRDRSRPLTPTVRSWACRSPRWARPHRARA
jgi:hypothetical protein